MENKQTPLSNNEDEMSLSSFLQQVPNLLAKFFYYLAPLLREIARTWYIIFLCGAIGAGLSWYSYMQKEKNALSGVEMLVVNSVLPQNVYGQIMDNLNTIISVKQTDQISKELRIDSLAATNVAMVRALTMRGDPLWADTSSKTGEIFKIIAEIKNTRIKDTLQTALLNYLNSNAYLMLIQKSKMGIAAERVALIDKDLAELDSLKKGRYRSLYRPVKLGDSASIVDLYLQSSILLDKRDSYQEFINTKYQPVMLVDGFKGGASLEKKAPLLPIMIKSIFSGLLIGLLCSVIIMVLRGVKNFKG